MAGPRRARRGGQRFDVVSVSESRRVRQSVCWCVCAVLRGPRGREAWVWAAAAVELGRAAAWRSRALGPAHFQIKSAFGRNRALSGRARRAKL